MSKKVFNQIAEGLNEALSAAGEIPEDIETTARVLNMRLHNATELGQRTQWIAEALLAEREANAKIAETTPIEYWDDKREAIAAAIRRR
jgi:primosomal protein N''